MDSNDPASALVALLDLEPLDRDLFRGARDPLASGRVFGGQVVAQALVAASRTVPAERQAHSLHAFFVRPGDDALPIIYHVERDRDGGSFSNRRVVARQNGEAILNMIASFHIDEPGLRHQDPMPEVPPPEELKSDQQLARELPGLPEHLRAFVSRSRGVEMRRTSLGSLTGEPGAPSQSIWMRLTRDAPDDPTFRRAILAYVSDFGLLGTAMIPHGVGWATKGLRSASIDHAVWFHDDPDVGAWHLYTMESSWAGGARAFNTGRMFSRDGRLIASTAQEGLMRVPLEKKET